MRPTGALGNIAVPLASLRRSFARLSGAGSKHVAMSANTNTSKAKARYGFSACERAQSRKAGTSTMTRKVGYSRRGEHGFP